MAKIPRKKPATPPAEGAALPSAVMIDVAIGWAENGVLRQFHEGQLVTHPDDIRDLIKHKAQYFEVNA